MTLSERNELILNYLPLTKKITKQIYNSINKAVEYEELQSVAFLAITHAAENFDTKYNFYSYASIIIKGRIIDFLRKNSKLKTKNILTDSLVENYVYIEEIIDCLDLKEKNIIKDYYIFNFSLKEIAEKLNLTEARISQLIKSCKLKVQENYASI